MVAGTVRGQVWSALWLRNVAGTRAAVIQGQQGGPSPGQDCKTESYSPKALLMWGQVIRKRRTRSKGSPVFRASECPLTCRCLKLETTLFITSLSHSLTQNDLFLNSIICLEVLMYMIRLLLKDYSCLQK